MKPDQKKDKLVGEVAAINIGDMKNAIPWSAQEGIFKKSYGLVGDKHSSPGNRQVTMFAAEGRHRINTIEADGLCVNRFYENLTIKDLDASKLSIGQELIIGAATFQITEIGKRCFPECNIVKKLEICSLKQGVIFAKVTLGGTVRVGDKAFLRSNK